MENFIFCAEWLQNVITKISMLSKSHIDLKFNTYFLIFWKVVIVDKQLAICMKGHHPKCFLVNLAKFL